MQCIEINYNIHYLIMLRESGKDLFFSFVRMPCKRHILFYFKTFNS